MKMIRDIISHHKIFICIALSLCVCVCVCVKLKNPFGNQPPIRQIVKLFRIFFQTVYTKVYLFQELDQASDDFFFFQMAAPAAYGSSQAGVELELQLGPVPSHSSTRCICNLWLSFWKFWVLMLSEARDQTFILIETLGP